MKKFILNVNIGRHISENFWFYILSFLAMATGIVLSLYTVKYMGGNNTEGMKRYFDSFTYNFIQENVKGQDVFALVIKQNIPYIIFMWLFGGTLIGIFFIFIIDFIKGFTLGFTISFIIKGLGVNGIWVSVLGILPQNIIFIPCIVLGSVLSMKFSMEILKSKINSRIVENYWKKFYTYSIAYLIILFIMLFGFLYQSYISPSIIKALIKG